MTERNRPYIGLNTSLYHTLDSGQIRLLERTIWLRRVGRYREALDIYQNKLGDVSDKPVIIIEHGSLYLEIREYGKLYRHVEHHLASMATNEAALDLPEWRLIAIMKAVVSLRHTGIVEPAVTEVVRMQQWLKDVHVSEYTDVQVNCVWRYVLAYIFVKHSANFEEPTWELIPKPDSGNEPWQGLADLRRSLLERRMVQHANGLFKVEINRTKLTERLKKWNEFIVVPGLLPDARCRAHAQADLHLRRCEDFISLHQLQLATQEAANCHTSLDNMLTVPEVEPNDDQYIRLHLQVICMDFIADPADKLAQAEELLVRLRERDHPNYSTCLDLAAETAKALYEHTGNADHLKKFYDLRRLHERLDELEHEDLVSLVGHQYDIFGPAVHDKVDSQKCLEWIDGFFAQYPRFAAPTTMASLYTYQAILLNGLQRPEEFKVAFERAQYWHTHSGNVSKLYHQSYSNIMAPGLGPVGSTDYDPEDDDSGFYFEQDNVAALSDKVQGAKIVLHKILNFAFEDLRNDRLKLGEFEVLLGFDEHDQQAVLSGPDVLLSQLKEANAVNLFGLIFIPKAVYTSKEEYKLTQQEEQQETEGLDRRWDALHEWLTHPPKGQRNDRLFTLLLLLDVRKQWLSDTKLYELRTKDFERLLKLHAGFPRMMKETCESWRGGWLSSKAWLHYTQFIELGNMDHGWSQVLAAQECVDLAIPALRDSRQAIATGFMQRLYSMLSLLKIRRLQQGKDPATKDEPHNLDAAVLASTIHDIRQQGLDAIMETDRIFSASEQEASWEDGAEGVRRRAHVAQMQQSYLTVHVAAQLVLHQPDKPPTEEDTHLLWNLVQNFKARSLARAIGMVRPSPPGLLDRIMQSTSGATYQKMVSLKDSIDEAEMKDRFHLRRELDALRLSMRKDPALRQLIDLREGTAFSLDELDVLAGQIGQPFAVVEWFWVPPYFNNPPLSTANGSIILLTSRKGGAITIDILDTDPQKVDKWIKECMRAKNARGMSRLDDAVAQSEFNRLCGSLVSPLAKRTSRDELLILCPTYEFNQLPLHALDVDGEPLIQRNPVVYIHALSLLRSCHSAAQYAADSKSALQPQVFSGIEATRDRYANGRQSVTDIATKLHVTPLIDKAAVKPDFLKCVTTSRLLHLHTHCHWDASDPLEHSLEFPDFTEGSSGSEEDGSEKQKPSHSSQQVLTAREVFSLHLQQGTHVNLIACSGGVMDLKVGDEPTGLVPALLYSGASSTVSTLWPIKDRAGASFSLAFFDYFIAHAKEDKTSKASTQDHQQAHSGAEREADKETPRSSNQSSGPEGLHWVDLAKAVQHAVLALDPDMTSMLNWAGFVLHGFWRLPVTQAEANGMGWSSTLPMRS